MPQCARCDKQSKAFVLTSEGAVYLCTAHYLFAKDGMTMLRESDGPGSDNLSVPAGCMRRFLFARYLFQHGGLSEGIEQASGAVMVGC